MATLSSPTTLSTACGASASYSSSANLSCCPFFANPSQLSVKRNNLFQVSCNASKPNDETSQRKLDRRDVLLGLGGLYSASTLISDPLAIAAPIQAPLIKDCGPPTGLPTGAIVTNNVKMGYTLQNVDIPWLKSKPAPRSAKSRVAFTSGAPSASSVFPVKLNKVVKVLVQRPTKKRSKKQKEEEEERLVIDGIEFGVDNYVKFDVFINDEDDNPNEFDKAEYLGSFAYLPYKNRGMKMVTTSRTFLLTEVLEDLDAEDDDTLLVTLAPKSSYKDITIGNVKIVVSA